VVLAILAASVMAATPIKGMGEADPAPAIARRR